MPKHRTPKHPHQWVRFTTELMWCKICGAIKETQLDKINVYRPSGFTLTFFDSVDVDFDDEAGFWFVSGCGKVKI